MRQKLSIYARRQGLSQRTAQRHAASGLIPGAVQSETGRWFIEGAPEVTTPDHHEAALREILSRLSRIEARLGTPGPCRVGEWLGNET